MNDLYQRIRVVSDYYRGANWQLFYDSDQGGNWSYKLTTPPEPADEEAPGIEDDPLRFIQAVRGAAQTPDPVFGMRCAELGVIAEALEHWHATVLARSGRQNPEEGAPDA